MNRFNPPAIVEEYVAPEHALSLKPEKNFKNAKEMYDWAFFHLSNPYRGEDGRTYYAIDKNGNYLSHYVSQYSKNIDDNLEPKIAPVVKALHSRKYLTAGSCQGHKAGDRRWVRVLFYSENARESFIEDLSASGVPLSFDTELPKMRQSSDQSKVLEYDEQYLTDMWNALVCRRYERFYSVRVIIANTSSLVFPQSRGPFWTRVRYHVRRFWFDYLVRWFLLDRYTRKLSEHIRGMPEYPL